MGTEKKVTVRVDASKPTGELKHVWRYIGYDECNYTHAPEGEELISKFGKLEDAPYYFRTHHMLCTGNCHGTYKWGSTNVYTEDGQGNPVYDWKVFDQILDIYLNNNGKPFFEIGFMPMDLVDPRFITWRKDSWEAYGEYKRAGWACPPKDYNKWKDLVCNIVRHCVERYGKAEVLTWYWELWNEPDIFYWKGTVEEFCKLYDYTEAAVHAVLADARLGGPGTTDPRPGAKSLDFLEKFLDHCANGENYVSGQKGTRLDYVTFHTKGGGFPFKINAKKETPSVKKLVSQVKTGLEAIQKYGYADREVVLSEADPDGWAAGGLYDNINMNFRNTEYYASYVAASYHHLEKVAKAMNMDVRPLAWAFLFIGERCFEGTRAFTTQGIDKAVFNLFKMYARMGNRSLSFESSREKDVLTYEDAAAGEEAEVSGFAAAAEDGSMQVLVYSHHDDWDVEEEIEVALELANIPAADRVRVKHYRIDRTHGNAYAEWVRLGKPKYPDREQYAAMKARDGLEMYVQEKTTALHRGTIIMEFTMPAHAVSFIEISGIS